jgi:outer membrane lipoprotein-sorting protein
MLRIVIGLTRRRTMALLGGLLLAGSGAHAALPPAEAEMVERIVAHLEGITTLESKFTQIAPDGRLATGQLWIARPGRMRLDYDPPSRILLIATDWRLVYYDGSIQQMNTIPLRETPLGFLLDSRVDLAEAAQIVDLERRANEIAIEVVRSDAPDQGSVQLWFAAEPLELRRWVVTDPQGLRTTVILEDAQYGRPADPELFRARDPQLFGWPK